MRRPYPTEGCYAPLSLHHQNDIGVARKGLLDNKQLNTHEGITCMEIIIIVKSQT
jgi:hypothetical protein